MQYLYPSFLSALLIIPSLVRHNDDPDYDGLPMLRHFQIPYLEQEGYVNIRCAWSLGCPSEIKPLEEEGEHRAAIHAGGDYKKAFEILFPGKEVPRYVGVSCCAQFAATKEKIRERKKEEYARYREWLLETDLGDSISGRILEYSWHSMFHLLCSPAPRTLPLDSSTWQHCSTIRRTYHEVSPASTAKLIYAPKAALRAAQNCLKSRTHPRFVHSFLNCRLSSQPSHRSVRSTLHTTPNLRNRTNSRRQFEANLVSSGQFTLYSRVLDSPDND